MALKRRNRVKPEFSLAAMIDVIFLLLMFFMLTSNVVTPNRPEPAAAVEYLQIHGFAGALGIGPESRRYLLY